MSSLALSAVALSISVVIGLPVTPGYSISIGGLSVASVAGESSPAGSFSAQLSRLPLALGCGPVTVPSPWGTEQRALVVSRGNCSWQTLVGFAEAAGISSLIVLERPASSYYPDSDAGDRVFPVSDPCRVDCGLGVRQIPAYAATTPALLDGLPGPVCGNGCASGACAAVGPAVGSPATLPACCLLSADLVQPPGVVAARPVSVYYVGLSDSTALLAAAGWPVSTVPMTLRISPGVPANWAPTPSAGFFFQRRPQYAIRAWPGTDAMRGLAPLIFGAIAALVAWYSHSHWQVRV
jgi:hypothetical protein